MILRAGMGCDPVWWILVEISTGLVVVSIGVRWRRVRDECWLGGASAVGWGCGAAVAQARVRGTERWGYDARLGRVRAPRHGSR